jgi:hypothetical protein
MRQATLHVLRECQKHNLRIDSFSTDGQWINLMTRDGKGNPTTIYQLQKDVWKEVKRMNKQELCKALANLNTQASVSWQQLQDSPKCLIVESGNRAFSSVTTNLKLFKAKKSDKNHEDRNDNDTCTTLVELHDSDWLPGELLRKVEEDSDSDLANAVRTVENAMHVLQEQDNCVQGIHLEDIGVLSSVPCENR